MLDRSNLGSNTKNAHVETNYRYIPRSNITVSNILVT